MEKRVFQFFSIISLVAALASAFFISWERQWIFPFGLLAAAFVFLMASRDIRKIFIVLIFAIPFLSWYNYLKFNLSFLSGWLNLPELSVNLTVGIYLLAIAITIVHFVFGKVRFWKAPFFYYLLPILIYFPLTIFWSAHPVVSFAEVIFFVTPLLLYLLAFDLFRTGKELKKVMLAVILSSVLPVAVGALQFLKGDFFYEPDSDLGRLSGTLGHPNPFGLFLMLAIMFSVIYIFSVRDKQEHWRRFLMIYLVPLAGIFYLTYSRTAWITLFIFLLFFLVTKKKYIWQAIGVFVIIASLIMIFPAPRERVAGIFERSMFDSVYARQQILQLGIAEFKEKPAFGYGIGQFEEVIMNAKESAEGSSLPHNDLVRFAVEGGIVAAVLYLIMSIGLIARLFYFTKNNSERNNPSAAIDSKSDISLYMVGRGLLIISVLFLVLTGMFEAISTKTVMLIGFWSVLGAFFGAAGFHHETQD